MSIRKRHFFTLAENISLNIFSLKNVCATVITLHSDQKLNENWTKCCNYVDFFYNAVLHIKALPVQVYDWEVRINLGSVVSSRTKFCVEFHSFQCFDCYCFYQRTSITHVKKAFSKQYHHFTYHFKTLFQCLHFNVALSTRERPHLKRSKTSFYQTCQDIVLSTIQRRGSDVL